MAYTRRPDPTRSEVRREYGHPWPWRDAALVERYAVEQDVDVRTLARRWRCSPKVLTAWIRRHGFRTEDHRAKR